MSISFFTYKDSISSLKIAEVSQSCKAMFQQFCVTIIVENNTIAIRYPPTFFIISFPGSSNCGARAFVVELVKQTHIAV